MVGNVQWKNWTSTKWTLWYSPPPVLSFALFTGLPTFPPPPQDTRGVWKGDYAIRGFTIPYQHMPLFIPRFAFAQAATVHDKIRWIAWQHHSVSGLPTTFCKETPFLISITCPFDIRGKRREMDAGVGSRFSPSQITRYTLDIVKGLEFLHKQGIIHRDLKVNCYASTFSPLPLPCSFRLCLTIPSPQKLER